MTLVLHAGTSQISSSRRGMSDEEAVAALAREQRRQALREGRPEAIAHAMAQAGLVSLPLVEDVCTFGAKTFSDERPVDLWFAVQTAPQMEIRAKSEIRKLGFQCYVPMRKFWKCLRQKDKHGNPLRKEASLPLCSGYAFLGLPEGRPDWRTLRSRDGVIGVVGACGTPQPIRRTLALYAIMQAEAAGEFDTTQAKPQPLLSSGDPVRVVSGPFAGLIGRIKHAKGDAARVIVDSLFGGVDVEMPQSQLEPA